eukprot:jgi/Mesen1/7036/ME000367S06251
MGLGTPAELFDGLLADLKHGSLSGPSVGFLAFSVILAVFLSLWLFKDRKAPPVVSTIPVIGGLLKFMKGPMVLVQDLYPKYGSVFTLPLFHMRITFLVGPEVSSHFYKAPEEQMSQQEVYRFNVPTFGPGVVFDVPYSIRMEQFRFFADALKASRIRTYVEMMVQEAQDYFGAWKEEGEVDLKEELAQLIILTASRCLLGKEVREQIVGNIVQLFHDLDEGMQPISVAFPYLPIAAHRKRDRARAELARIFKKIIDTRKAQGTKEEDMLQVFIDSKYRSSGRSTTADEVTGFLIAALFGGQHTSSLTAAWLGIYLMTVKTREGKEYVVPKNNIVATVPIFANRLPHVYSEPNKFDPDRFAPGREEDKGMPFAYVSFGGGKHGCMGESFAYMQIKAIWSVLLRSFDFELLSGYPESDYSSLVVGPKGAVVARYKRRTLPALA